MKKGAALSVVLAPGGTAMFWVTQGCWARAAGMRHTADINAPVRTADIFFIVFSRKRRDLGARLDGKYDDRPAGGQFRWNLDALIYFHHTPSCSVSASSSSMQFWSIS